MKRLIGAAAAGVALMLALTGCAGATGSGGDAGGAANPDDLIVGFSQVGAESGWRTANTISIQSAFKDAGIELKFSDAQQKQENQIKAIRSYIQQAVDVIAFSPVVESGWDTVLKEAKDAGIPVVLTDRSVDSEDDSLYVSSSAPTSFSRVKRPANGSSMNTRMPTASRSSSCRARRERLRPTTAQRDSGPRSETTPSSTSWHRRPGTSPVQAASRLWRPS